MLIWRTASAASSFISSSQLMNHTACKGTFENLKLLCFLLEHSMDLKIQEQLVTFFAFPSYNKKSMRAILKKLIMRKPFEMGMNDISRKWHELDISLLCPNKSEQSRLTTILGDNLVITKDSIFDSTERCIRTLSENIISI